MDFSKSQRGKKHKELENCPLQDLRGLLPRRKKAVNMGNQKTEARWLWEVRNHRAAYSVCAEAERKAKAACGRERGEGKNERDCKTFCCMRAWINTCTALKKKKMLLCLGKQPSVIRRYKVTQG